MRIDTSFSFTDDTPGFWDGFWDDGIGTVRKDPDVLSPGLLRCHMVLWSRELPCGRRMELEEAHPYLGWDGMRFSSDSITTFFRSARMRDVLSEVAERVGDYHAFAEDIIRRTYTAGGSVIFPRHRNSINQRRGMHPRIRDRRDRTLECIRRFYAGEESPLSDVLEADRDFFALFLDFRGYVDFFLLQDCVDRDYNVVSQLGPMDLDADPLPQDADEYMAWVRSELDFVEKRNRRISYLLRGERVPDRCCSDIMNICSLTYIQKII